MTGGKNFWKGSGRGQDSLQESESFIHSNRFACCILLSVLDTVWKTKVLANKPEKICLPASNCSKEVLESLSILFGVSEDQKDEPVPTKSDFISNYIGPF